MILLLLIDVLAVLAVSIPAFMLLRQLFREFLCWKLGHAAPFRRFGQNVCSRCKEVIR